MVSILYLALLKCLIDHILVLRIKELGLDSFTKSQGPLDQVGLCMLE